MTMPPPPLADPLFPPAEPFAQHRLAVGQGHRLYVEECGNPDGLPALFLHGGPGSGSGPAHRRFFDPARFRAVLFDQRGSGRSTPLGSLRANTTAELVADIERIRSALGIARWLVFGGSWGSLLGLAYARHHPDRVLGLVLRGIFLGSTEELKRYCQGVDSPAPAAWRHFAAAMPKRDSADLLGAYTRRLLSSRRATRIAAARHWLDYERALMGEPPLAGEPDAGRLAKARIQGHYLAHGCFVRPGELLSACEGIRHLPAAIVQGSLDPVCPPRTAELLHRAWPEAEYIRVEGARHGAFDPPMAAACRAALASVAGRCADFRAE